MSFVQSWLNDKLAKKAVEKAVNVIWGQSGEGKSSWNFLVEYGYWQSDPESQICLSMCVLLQTSSTS